MTYFRRVPIRYRTVIITAAVLATLFLFQAYMHHFVYKDLKDMGEFRWWREAPVPYLNFFFWALLCPLVYIIFQRWPFTTRPLGPVIAVHIGFGFLIAAFHEVVTSSIYYSILQSLGEFDFSDPKYRDWAYHALLPAIFTRTMEYWVLMGVLVALDSARLRRVEHEQLLRVKNELQATQLSALKKQLQPHFLFNTLNTVSALMDEHIGDARKVLSRLGQLLRITLDQSRADKVALEQEIDYVRNYLDIESIRFRDRLLVRYDVPPDLMKAQVPGLVLQPLVENAIKHGTDSSHERVEITVRAQRVDGRLALMVADNGKGCRDVHKAMSNGGIGLRNVRERMRLLYGDAGNLMISSPEGIGFTATVNLPLDLNTN
ncbi:MAG: histidine kinase [Flavobacteriales bacterium]|jgi:two-component sensor histidine kinase|nr:histidine kinase [Flavobacteriales bacterium]